LIPEFSFSCGYLAVVDLFFARLARRWGAVLGGLLAPLADTFHEINDLVTLRGAVATVGVHKAWTAATPLRPWAFVAVASAPGRGSND
jgi:hypothetical protein